MILKGTVTRTGEILEIEQQTDNRTLREKQRNRVAEFTDRIKRKGL